MKRLPIARSEDIVIQELDDEVLVYDLLTHKAYCLNLTARRVYSACDGESSFEEIKRKYKFNDEVIFLALEELKEANLIEADGSDVPPFAGMSRREVIKKVGLASMVALPVISSLVAPTALAAASCAPGGTVIGNVADPTCTLNAAAASAACDAQYGSLCCSGHATLLAVTDGPPPPCEVSCQCT